MTKTSTVWNNLIIEFSQVEALSSSSVLYTQGPDTIAPGVLGLVTNYVIKHSSTVV